MTYVRTYGRPDLFITFTCNPGWTEIKEMLKNGQVPSDRHNLIARVFRQKQFTLIELITKAHVFGPPRCWMYTIEYQKRGLPHSHNLIWLAGKIQPTQIDEVISAELPDPREDPNLYTVVTKNMIHGPCGNINPNSPCMKDGKCSKRYSRELIKETQTGDDGYPRYRRRAPQDGGFTAKVKLHGTEIEIDNRWVVPFSPLLSKMFQAHINVEYCNSVKSIKYVCKYVNKGSDMAVFSLNNEKTNNEVIQYQLGRYISSSEAVWWILGFPIHERHPTVVHLSVHLENGQRVHFTMESAPRVVEQPPNTTLTAFFKLCKEDPFARTLLYPEVPRYYTWNAPRKVFCRRKVGQHLPGHNIVESDALVRGPTSFSALRTINGEVCQTYREACQKLGLLEGDQHWDNTLREAKLISLPDQIRNLFAIILTTCSPSNPNTLWEKYKEALSEDILAKTRRENPTLEITFCPEIFNRALIILENKCIAMINKTLVQLGLQAPVRDQQDVLNSDYMREKNYNMEELRAYVADKKPLLNQDQRKGYQIIIDHITRQQGDNLGNLNWLCERAILAAKNEDVREINNQIFSMIPGAVTEYKSFDTVVDADEAVNFPPEFLNSLDPAGLPQHRLSLKVGCPIILLRNLESPKLCNGTRLCVKNMLPNVLEATILTGKGKGETVFIPRIPLIPTDLPFTFKRLQLQVTLAFSITINKSQGQSIWYCGVDLRSPCFSHGQLYVACSRVGSPNSLFILANAGETKNIVYKQVLQ
ncbi:uncharacterized protein LOC120930449 [Rana temporaria]|uniref:uncharacterized protein LOC120930449 n=1 Tax=Rana temporaria TaxID=8407 RepID=UPI001AADA3BA|nr:uncharacterized protein LOC120930449 [Rana temporaria]